MRWQDRNTTAWVIVGIVVLGVGYYQLLLKPDMTKAASNASGPASDVALAGGGTSDGSHCGAKGYHYFAVSAVTDTGGMPPGTPAGPGMVLGSYGTQSGAHDPGHFTINLELAPGSRAGAFDLSAPLGPSGVAVEIEGPNGLVGGAHDLPVTLDTASTRLPGGKIRVGGDDGLSADVVLPAAALCPGYDVPSVGQNLFAPVDSNDTITGQPPYTLTVSISDPAITVLRREAGSSATGPVLAADNLNPP